LFLVCCQVLLGEVRRLLLVRAKERFSKRILSWPYGGVTAEVRVVGAALCIRCMTSCWQSASMLFCVAELLIHYSRCIHSDGARSRPKRLCICVFSNEHAIFYQGSCRGPI
jgi:hypothetical protein